MVVSSLIFPVVAVVASVGSYSATYPVEVAELREFMSLHRNEMESQMRGLNQQQRREALAIVAPEISQYNTVLNVMELQSLFVLYVYGNTGDFSIGPFQMKPSFAEDIEHRWTSDKWLRKKYADWYEEVASTLDNGSKMERRARLHRLNDLKWQTRYLTLFYHLAGSVSRKITFKSGEQRVAYFATLYNAGLDKPWGRVQKLQKNRQFPHGRKTHNYSDVAVEMYFNVVK